MADQYAVSGTTATMACLAVARDVSEFNLTLTNGVTKQSQSLTYNDNLTPVTVSKIHYCCFLLFEIRPTISNTQITNHEL